MKTHNLIPNAPEWLAYRRTMRNASDAPAMMGCSPYKTRTDFLRECATGITADVDAGTQRLFDDGHRFEALARPLAEKIIGEELDAVVGSEGRYSASFDGLTLMQDVGWEHKSLSAVLRALLPADGVGGPETGAALPLMYRVQMEQQCMVSGAGKELFTASKWTQDGELVEARHCWYEPDAELRADIINAWEQFERDLAAYVPPAATEPAPLGRAPETLPALNIEVTGMVTRSNLAEFKQTALAAIQSVNRSLKTDQDFADAAKAVKWCEDIESRIKAAKEHALSQTSSIEELFRTLDEITAESKRVRLDVSKIVDKRKTEVKEESVSAARAALDAHIADLHGELAPMRLQPVAADFAGSIRGLRSIASMQDALDTTLANAKIEADSQARKIRANVATFKADSEGLEFLFADLGAIVHKSNEDFALLVQSRIHTHKAAEAAKEAKRHADEAARIAAAEQRAREQEAARIAAARAESDRLEALAVANRERMAAEARAEAAAAVGVVAAPGQYPAPVHMLQDVHRGLIDTLASKPDAMAHAREAAAAIERQPAAAAPTEPATLSLGAICGRLGFNVSGDFLRDVLHVSPAKTDKRAMLYTESQYQAICRQLLSHIGAMAELYAGEPA
jgi:predicted phage-related endonuclease